MYIFLVSNVIFAIEKAVLAIWNAVLIEISAFTVAAYPVCICEEQMVALNEFYSKSKILERCWYLEFLDSIQI